MLGGQGGVDPVGLAGRKQRPSQDRVAMFGESTLSTVQTRCIEVRGEAGECLGHRREVNRFGLPSEPEDWRRR